MRVLLVSDMYARADRIISAQFVHRQVQEVTRLGVEVRVLCPIPTFPWYRRSGLRRREGIEQSELDGVPVVRMRFSKPLPYGPAARLGGYLLGRSLRRQVAAILDDFDFDLIHGIRLYPIVSSLLPIAAEVHRPLLGMAMGSDVHTHPYRSRGIRRLTRRAIEESDAVAAVSRALGRGVLDLGEPKWPIRTVYNGVDTTKFRPTTDPKSLMRSQLDLPVDGTGVCTVCRVEREKGLRELLDAFERVYAEHQETWLVVVGTGSYSAELEHIVKSRNLESSVFLVGARPHEEIPCWLNAADVFVLASYNEGLPNVVLEAMACGLPVVSTDVGGTSEAVRLEETGFLVQAGAVDPLAYRLEQLVADEGTRRRFGSAARQRVLSSFGWRESAESLIDLYCETVERHQSGGSSPASGGWERRRTRESLGGPAVGRVPG